MSSAESIFGTKTNTFLVKSTSVLAVVFFFTCLSLAFMSIQHNKSILSTSKYSPKKTAPVKEAPKTTAPQAPQEPVKASAQATAATQTTVAQQPTAPAVPTQATTAQNAAPATTQNAVAQVEKK
jgi:preprotein translocase subunit SecG